MGFEGSETWSMFRRCCRRKGTSFFDMFVSSFFGSYAVVRFALTPIPLQSDARPRISQAHELKSPESMRSLAFAEPGRSRNGFVRTRSRQKRRESGFSRS